MMAVYMTSFWSCVSDGVFWFYGSAYSPYSIETRCLFFLSKPRCSTICHSSSLFALLTYRFLRCHKRKSQPTSIGRTAYMHPRSSLTNY